VHNVGVDDEGNTMAFITAATSWRVAGMLVAALGGAAIYVTHASGEKRQAQLLSLEEQTRSLAARVMDLQPRLDALERRLAEYTTAHSASSASHADLEVATARLQQLDQQVTSLAPLREQLSQLGQQVARLADTDQLLQRADAGAVARAREASEATLRETQRLLAELESRLPTRQQIEADVAAQHDQLFLASVRKLLASSAEQLQMLGLAQLDTLDADTFLTELRAYLTRVDPSRSPEAVRLALALLSESSNPRFRLALIDAASGQLNPRIVPQALVSISALDLEHSPPELRRLSISGVLKAPLIDEPDRFNTIVDLMRSALGTNPTREQIAPLIEGLEIRAPLLQFAGNFLSSRLLGAGAVSAYPVVGVDKLGSSQTPQLNASNRERALYLCRAARAVGAERDVARFLLDLVPKTTSVRGSSEEQPRAFLIKLLEELSGLAYAEDWARWRAWANGNS
jgi:hypothetical protein